VEVILKGESFDSALMPLEAKKEGPLKAGGKLHVNTSPDLKVALSFRSKLLAALGVINAKPYRN